MRAVWISRQRTHTYYDTERQLGCSLQADGEEKERLSEVVREITAAHDAAVGRSQALEVRPSPASFLSVSFLCSHYTCMRFIFCAGYVVTKVNRKALLTCLHISNKVVVVCIGLRSAGGIKSRTEGAGGDGHSAPGGPGRPRDRYAPPLCLTCAQMHDIGNFNFFRRTLEVTRSLRADGCLGVLLLCVGEDQIAKLKQNAAAAQTALAQTQVPTHASR
eukprot:COSAG05_NODE_398_length_10293_cov_11.919176_2_plen_218_part_00